MPPSRQEVPSYEHTPRLNRWEATSDKRDKRRNEKNFFGQKRFFLFWNWVRVPRRTTTSKINECTMFSAKTKIFLFSKHDFASSQTGDRRKETGDRREEEAKRQKGKEAGGKEKQSRDRDRGYRT